MKKTVCVLGGTGFIGKRLLIKLTQAGFNVNVITRHKKRHMELNNYPNIKLIEANVHSADNLERLFADCNVIVNLIGILNNGKGQSSYRKVHVDIVRKIINAIKKTKINRIIHVSALGADSSMARSGYLQSKGEAENILKVQVNARTAVTVLRPSLVFGKDGGFVALFSRLLNRFKRLPLAYPNAKVMPIFVDDVANAIIKCIDNSDTFGKSFNLCGEKSYTLHKVEEIMNHAQKSNTKVIPLSNFKSKMQARILGKLLGKVFTMDNYDILQYDAKKTTGIDFVFDSKLKPFQMWAQENLQTKDSREKYFEFRKSASR